MFRVRYSGQIGTFGKPAHLTESPWVIWFLFFYTPNIYTVSPDVGEVSQGQLPLQGRLIKHLL